MRLDDYARKYLGTPFKHRGRDARGLDCAGLVWRAFFDAGLTMPDLARYGREPNRQGRMMAVVREALGVPVWEGKGARSVIQPGDVLVMRFEVEPHHMAIAAPDAMYGMGMIHADGTPGVRRVVEHGMMDLHFDRVLAVFRRPV